MFCMSFIWKKVILLKADYAVRGIDVISEELHLKFHFILELCQPFWLSSTNTKSGTSSTSGTTSQNI